MPTQSLSPAAMNQQRYEGVDQKSPATLYEAQILVKNLYGTLFELFHGTVSHVLFGNISVELCEPVLSA